MERTVGAILGEAPAERARELRDIGRDGRSGTVTLLPNDHWAHGGALTEESASPERSQPRPRGMQRERSREMRREQSRRPRQRSRTRDVRPDERWERSYARDARASEHRERICNADGTCTQGHAALSHDGRMSRPGRRGLEFGRLGGQWAAEATSAEYGTLEPRRAPSAAGGRLDQVRAQVRGPEDWGWSWGSPPRSPRVHAPDVADVPMWRQDRAWKPENRQPPSRGGGWDSASEQRGYSPTGSATPTSEGGARAASSSAALRPSISEGRLRIRWSRSEGSQVSKNPRRASCGA